MGGAEEPIDPGAVAPAPQRAFASRLTAGLDSSGRSLTWLQSRLTANGHRVSLGALSYWRSGQRQPEHATSLDALAEIERLLALSPGHLRDAVEPSRRPGPPLPATDFDDLIADPHPRVGAALRELGLQDWTEHVTELSSHVVVSIDAQGCEHAVRTRAVLRGRAAGARRYPFFLFAGEPIDSGVTFTPLGGGSVGAEVSDPASGLFMAEILLERPLDPGETAFVEVDMTFAPQRFLGYQQFVSRRIGELVIVARFHPDRLPTTIETFRDVDGHLSTLPFDRAAGTSAHQLLRSFGPGTAGITWAWAD